MFTDPLANAFPLLLSLIHIYLLRRSDHGDALAGYASVAETGHVVCDRLSDAGLSDAVWQRPVIYRGQNLLLDSDGAVSDFTGG